MNDGQDETRPRGRDRITPEMVGGNRALGENERGMGRFAGMIGGSFATVFLLLVVGIVTIVVALAIWGS